MVSSLRTTSTPTPAFPLGPDEQSQHELVTLPLSESKVALTDEGPTKEREWVSGLPLTIILGAICLVCFLMLLDTSIVVTAIPQITSDFHSLQDVGWYGSAYQLARCANPVVFS